MPPVAQLTGAHLPPLDALEAPPEREVQPSIAVAESHAEVFRNTRRSVERGLDGWALVMAELYGTGVSSP
ncbi:MAG: hypothetical protein JNL21_29330 [Myxococcales bacterium]|nr:hypothetical protein [Myxococcales bacterium]